MGALRVGSLALSLRLPPVAGDRAGALRETVERRFVPAVLDALSRELDATYGDTAIIRIRLLRMRLRIGPDVRNAAELARQVGRDLAAHVRDTAQIVLAVASPPDADAEVRIWPTAGVWHGSALVAALHAQPGPDGEVDDLGTATKRLMQEPSDVVIAALLLCDEAGLLPDLLFALPEAVLRTILARCGAALQEALRTAITAALDRVADPADLSRAEAIGASRRGVAKPPPGPLASPDPPQGDDQAPQSDVVPRSAGKVSAPGETASMRPPDIAISKPRAEPVTDVEPPGSSARSAGFSAGGAAPVHGPGDQPVDRWVPPPAGIADLPPDPIAEWPTSWGGLVYLVTLAVRLGMPEALWRIGVPEGAALAAMLAEISGSGNDPLLALMVPLQPDAPALPGVIPDWAKAEFCKTMAQAARDLTGRDPGDRIRIGRDPIERDGVWNLSEWGASLLFAALEDLIGRPLAAGVPPAFLAIEGRVESGPDLICVRLPLAAIDLDVRRAGLDANPGLLPWLDKRLVIAFGSGEEDWAG